MGRPLLNNKKSTTLHRRLLLFFVLVCVCLILVFALLLVLFGITGRESDSVRNHLSTELSIISDQIEDELGRISLGGVALAEEIAQRSDDFFAEHQIAAGQLPQHPDLLEPLLAEHIQSLISIVDNRICGGAFILLDATVNPQAENAEYAKAGVFLKKTNPTATATVGVDTHYLRGPAGIARDNEIMLIGQWKMEFDIQNQPFFTQVMDAARENPELPLSRLYYWSGRVTLKGNSEAGFLLCVPLISGDGTVIGLCGVEVSDRMFKSLYTPEGGRFDNIFTVMAPVCTDGLATSQGLLAGNYYLTGNRWGYDLHQTDSHEDFVHFAGGTERYGGMSTTIDLYPSNSPYADRQWAVAILMPQEMLHSAVAGSNPLFIYIVVALLAVSLVVSALITRRYLKPVNEAFHSIRNETHQGRKATAIAEIDDLFEFLSDKDREHAQTVLRLHDEKNAVRSQYEQAQTYITHLADERMPEVDAQDYEIFLRHLHTLTPKEQEIFAHYLSGKTAKQIMELSGINQNTLKYHNKNIYSKLGVSSRKQLLEFAALMKYGGGGQP